MRSRLIMPLVDGEVPQGKRRNTADQVSASVCVFLALLLLALALEAARQESHQSGNAADQHAESRRCRDIRRSVSAQRGRLGDSVMACPSAASERAPHLFDRRA
jgi:hypothetical protein